MAKKSRAHSGCDLRANDTRMLPTWTFRDRWTAAVPPHPSYCLRPIVPTPPPSCCLCPGPLLVRFTDMRFGTKLQTSIYEAWKDSYLHYARLKNMLYEGQSDDEWGERNESRFVEELDSELEKVINPQFTPSKLAHLSPDICLPAQYKSTNGESDRRVGEGSRGVFQGCETDGSSGQGSDYQEFG